MPAITAHIALDELPIEFVIGGTASFTIDVLEAEVLLEEVSDGWKKDFRAYREPLKAELHKRVGVELKDSQLFKFVEVVCSAYTAFKKKLDAELPSALGLESTPSPSPNENTSS